MKCLEKALCDTNYNEWELLFLQNIVPTTVDGAVYEWAKAR